MKQEGLEVFLGKIAIKHEREKPYNQISYNQTFKFRPYFLQKIFIEFLILS